MARQTDCEVVGEAADGLSGLKLIEQTRPDVVLLDLDMPVMNGRETLAQIMSVHPEQTVLIDAVKKAYHGDNIFSPEMTARLVQSLIRPHQPESTPLDELTARELEILGHLSAGHSNKIIARHLDLAESTVKVHVQNILRKLELDSRVQAAVYAVQHNIPLPDLEKHNNK